MLANPKLPPALREIYAGQQGLISDYARFVIKVDEVLSGKAPRRLIVTWDNSTYPEPQTMPVGSFVFALSRPPADRPSLRGPSPKGSSHRRPKLMTILQAPCTEAFIIGSGNDDARVVRGLLAAADQLR
jgi:hypothetical protein